MRKKSSCGYLVEIVDFNSVCKLYSLNYFDEPHKSAHTPPSARYSLVEIEDHAQHAVSIQIALATTSAMPNRRKRPFYRIGGTDALPMRRRQIVRRQQLLLILLQAPTGFGILLLVSFDKLLKRLVRVLVALSHPDPVQWLFDFRLTRFQQLIEHIGSLVHPTALMAVSG